MVAPPIWGVETPPHIGGISDSKIGDISGNYYRISTKFSEISLLPRRCVQSEDCLNMLLLLGQRQPLILN